MTGRNFPPRRSSITLSQRRREGFSHNQSITLTISLCLFISEDHLPYSHSSTYPPSSSRISGMDIGYIPVVDWRDNGYIPVFRNQRSANVCLFLSSTETLEAMELVYNERQILLSEQVFIDGYYETHPNRVVHARWFMDYVGRNPMTTTPINYPINTDYAPQPFDPAKIVPPKVGAIWIKLDSLNRGNHASLESAMMEIVDQQPLGFMRASTDDLMLYDGGSYETHCDGRVNHAVVIIAYGSVNGKNCWVLQQNYGEKWGDNGFMTILRGSNMCGIETKAYYPVPLPYNVYEEGRYPSGPGSSSKKGRYPFGPGSSSKGGRYPSGPGSSSKGGRYPSGPGSSSKGGRYPSGPGSSSKKSRASGSQSKNRRG